MEERQQAWQIAHQWLDFRMNSLTQMVPGDPDCDACVLARQYMRALDTINQLQELCARLHAGAALSETMVLAALASRWPRSIQDGKT